MKKYRPNRRWVDVVKDQSKTSHSEKIPNYTILKKSNENMTDSYGVKTTLDAKNFTRTLLHMVEKAKLPTLPPLPQIPEVTTAQEKGENDSEEDEVDYDVLSNELNEEEEQQEQVEEENQKTNIENPISFAEQEEEEHAAVQWTLEETIEYGMTQPETETQNQTPTEMENETQTENERKTERTSSSSSAVETKRSFAVSPLFPFYRNPLPIGMKEIVIFLLDTELTGLKRSQILELAILFTNSNLEDLGLFRTVCHVSRDKLFPQLEEWSKKTHQNTGLLDDVAHSNLTSQQVDQQLYEFLITKFPNPERYIFFPAGISINKDLKVIEKELPLFHSLLHYQTIEISGIHKLANLWSPNGPRRPKKFSPRHRALPDVYSAFNLLLYYKATLFQPYDQVPLYTKLLDSQAYQHYIDFLMKEKITNQCQITTFWSTKLPPRQPFTPLQVQNVSRPRMYECHTGRDSVPASSPTPSPAPLIPYITYAPAPTLSTYVQEESDPNHYSTTYFTSSSAQGEWYAPYPVMYETPHPIPGAYYDSSFTVPTY